MNQKIEYQCECAKSQKSWWSRFLGRSLLKAVVGDFFVDKNNAASLIALILVITLCYLAVMEKNSNLQGVLANVVFVVIGYYFGAKREKGSSQDDDSL